MKLYTEEQLLNTVNAIQSYIEKFGKDGAQPTIKNHLKMLSPIELPSDEEIREEGLLNFPNSEYVDRSNDRLAYYVGAKWMKEQILGKEDKTFKKKSQWTEVDNMTRRLK